MNDNVRLWLAALRSGEFQQGHQVLQTLSGTFCCLGVACEVYRRETGDGEWLPRVDPRPSYAFHTSVGDASGTALPSPVMKWLGLDALVTGEGAFQDDTFIAVNPVRRNTHNMPLSALNDNHGFTFEQIADEIEQRDWLFEPETV